MLSCFQDKNGKRSLCKAKQEQRHNLLIKRMHQGYMVYTC